MTQRYGDDESGFSIESDLASRSVQVSAWGFWTPETARAFAPSVIEACRSARALAVVFDTGALKPQREEGQEAISSLLTALPTIGVSRVSLASRSQLTKLQILRIVKERGLKDLVQFT